MPVARMAAVAGRPRIASTRWPACTLARTPHPHDNEAHSYEFHRRRSSRAAVRRGGTALAAARPNRLLIAVATDRPDGRLVSRHRTARVTSVRNGASSDACGSYDPSVVSPPGRKAPGGAAGSSGHPGAGVPQRDPASRSRPDVGSSRRWSALVVAVSGWLVPWRGISPRFQVLPLLSTRRRSVASSSRRESRPVSARCCSSRSCSPLLWRAEGSLLVIPAITVAQALLGVASNDSFLVLVRVLIVWVALTTMISLAAHALRGSLQATVTPRGSRRGRAPWSPRDPAMTATLDPDLSSAPPRVLRPSSSRRTHPERAAASTSSSTETNVRLVARATGAGCRPANLCSQPADHPRRAQSSSPARPSTGLVDLERARPGVRASLEAFGSHARRVCGGDRREAGSPAS